MTYRCIYAHKKDSTCKYQPTLLTHVNSCLQIHKHPHTRLHMSPHQHMNTYSCTQMHTYTHAHIQIHAHAHMTHSMDTCQHKQNLCPNDRQNWCHWLTNTNSTPSPTPQHFYHSCNYNENTTKAKHHYGTHLHQF